LSEYCPTNVLVTTIESPAQGQIAGSEYSGSNQKAARAERCTPKTTAAELDG